MVGVVGLFVGLCFVLVCELVGFVLFCVFFFFFFVWGWVLVGDVYVCVGGYVFYARPCSLGG